MTFGGLVWRSAQSIVTPYVIEVGKNGQVRAVGEAATPYQSADGQIVCHLANFITQVRSFSIDLIVVRQNWLDAHDYYGKNDSFARVFACPHLCRHHPVHHTGHGRHKRPAKSY